MKNHITSFLLLFLFLPITSKAEYYNFCWGKRDNGTIFCSSVINQKGDIDYCKLWTKDKFNDRYKWGYKQNTNKSSLEDTRKDYCDNIIINENNDYSFPFETRYFYLGCVETSESPFIKYKLTGDQLEKYISITDKMNSSGSITCSFKNTHFRLIGNPYGDDPVFTLGKVDYLPQSHEDFYISNDNCFSTSSTYYRDIFYPPNEQKLPYYKDVTLYNVSELLLNPGKEYSWGKFKCKYHQFID